MRQLHSQPVPGDPESQMAAWMRDVEERLRALEATPRLDSISVDQNAAKSTSLNPFGAWDSFITEEWVTDAGNGEAVVTIPVSLAVRYLVVLSAQTLVSGYPATYYTGYTVRNADTSETIIAPTGRMMDVTDPLGGDAPSGPLTFFDAFSTIGLALPDEIEIVAAFKTERSAMSAGSWQVNQVALTVIPL